MSEIASERAADRTDTVEELRPPATEIGVIGWLRQNLFNSVLNSILTILALWLIIYSVPKLVSWALLTSVWTGTAAECRADGAGACWAFVREQLRLILFGTYPGAEHWRPTAAIILFLGLVGVSTLKRLWNWRLLVIWVVGLSLYLVLLGGGIFGLTSVPNTRWGGLPLTLLLSIFGIGVAFPLGIVLALGRTSNMPAIKAICVGYIELIRGVPLITVLFMSSVMFPLFLPEGMTIDKLLRAQVGIILFAAAYLAEVVRGGLQAVPKGQYEAADALGLSYWQQTWLIVMPQALKIAIPPIVNTFIGLFKDTSLVLIIGLFDLMTTTKVSLTDPKWLGFSVEAYLFTACIYFAFCFFMSKYSQNLEKHLTREHR